MKRNPVLVHRTFTVIKYSRPSNINESVCVLSPCRHLPQMRWNADSTEGRHPLRSKGICTFHAPNGANNFPGVSVWCARQDLFALPSKSWEKRNGCLSRIGEQDDAEEGQFVIKKENAPRGQVRAENEKKLTFRSYVIDAHAHNCANMAYSTHASMNIALRRGEIVTSIK